MEENKKGIKWLIVIFILLFIIISIFLGLIFSNTKKPTKHNYLVFAEGSANNSFALNTIIVPTDKDYGKYGMYELTDYDYDDDVSWVYLNIYYIEIK